MSGRRRGGATPGAKATFGLLRADRLITVVAIVVVLVAALLITILPASIDQVSAESLQTVLDNASDDAHLLTATVTGLETETDQNFETPERLAGEFHDSYLSPALQIAFPRPSVISESTGFRVLPSGDPSAWIDTDIRLLTVPDWEEHASVEEGALDGGRDNIGIWNGSECPPGVAGVIDPEVDDSQFLDQDGNWVVECHPIVLPLVETGLSAATMSTLDLAIGDVIIVRPPSSGSFGTDFPFYDIALVVSASIEVDTSDAFWSGFGRLVQPGRTTNRDLDVIAWHIVGLIHPADHWRTSHDFLASRQRHHFRHVLDEGGVTPGSAGRVADDLRALQTRAFPGEFLGTEVSTGLLFALEQYESGRSSVTGTLSAALVGMATTCLGVLGLLGTLLYARHRRSLVLMRGRGASPTQITLSQTGQAMTVAIPGVALAVAATRWLAPDATGGWWGPGALLLLSTPAVFALSGARIAHGRLANLLRPSSDTTRPSSRALVAEMTVLVAALTALWVITRRPAEEGEIDLLAAAEPVLLAVAGGLITARLLALLVQGMSKIASRARGASGFLGLRRLHNDSGHLRAGILVLVLAVAMATYSHAARLGIADQLELTAFRSVAADYRVTGSFPGERLNSDLDLESVPDVSAVAWGATTLNARTTVTGFAPDLLGVDGETYSRVVSGAPAGLGALPAALASFEQGAGTAQSPIAAVVSSNWGAAQPLPLGEQFGVVLGLRQVWFEVAAIVDEFPGLASDRPFVVADRTAVSDAGATASMIPDTAFVRGGPGARQGLEAEVDAKHPSATVTSRVALLSEAQQRPTTRALQLGLSAVAWVLTAMVILASVLVIVNGHRRRERDVGFFRIMGMSSRQTIRMVTLETVATVVVCGLVGTFLGLWSLRLLGGRVDLPPPPDNPFVYAAVALVLGLIAVALAQYTARRRVGPPSPGGLDGDS